MSRSEQLVYLVVGEESGDALGADLVDALRRKSKEMDITIDFAGLGGKRLQRLGLQSLFDIEDISVMGITAVIGRLPKIIERVHRTVADIIKKQPDLIVLIDSPDFTHAVAKRVRRKRPEIPIVNYVCPSVWAWRSGRAPKMRAYVDHVLALLPFEPQALKRLNGPAATYVGHPLAYRLAHSSQEKASAEKGPQTLLVLPGSRASELTQLLDIFGETIDILEKRGNQFQAVLPAVPHLRQRIEEQTSNWRIRPKVVDSADNDTTFPNARAALIASGTVSLQLALHAVPHVSAYKFDAFSSQFLRFVKIWSANLPNLIADRIVVPEEIGGMVMPKRLARHLEALLSDTAYRQSQIDGFDTVKNTMSTPQPPAELAAEVAMSYLIPSD